MHEVSRSPPRRKILRLDRIDGTVGSPRRRVRTKKQGMLLPHPRRNESPHQDRNHAPCVDELLPVPAPRFLRPLPLCVEFLRLRPANAPQRQSGLIRVGLSPQTRSRTGGGTNPAPPRRVSRWRRRPPRLGSGEPSYAALRLDPGSFAAGRGKPTDTINTLFSAAAPP